MTIIVRKAAEEDLLALVKHDFTWEATGRFNIQSDANGIHFSEDLYPSPVLRGNNTHYHAEIERYASMCDAPDSMTLIALVNNVPVGYVSAFIEEWKDGLVINADGILVARNYRKQGIAKALLLELVKQGRDRDCRGIMIEMDTEKYEANKLLLSVGFVLAGTRFYIYSNDDPKIGSKEAIYFYYKL